MITLYRMIRIWQLRIKYKLALYELLEEIEKKFVHEFAEIIHNSNNIKLNK